MHTAASTPNANYGYPVPGPQQPTGQDVMDNVFFVGPDDWERIRAQERFDHIVIGTGHCGLAFAERVLQRRPEARILMLERGTFFLAEHFQNLPLPYEQTLGGLSETFPWTLSSRTVNGRHIRWQHGMVPFVGGRSIMWSAWCPRPTEAEMAGWPRPVIDVAHEYFDSAERLLNVVSADDIDSGPTAPPLGYRPVFGVLQHRLTERLGAQLHRIPAATRVMAAPLAVGAPQLHGVDFDKFATPGPLLSLVDRQRRLAVEGHGNPLHVLTGCTVRRVVSQDGRATALDTSRGMITVGDADVVLAMGTLPPTTLMLNSFPQLRRAGERFTAHFISAVVARVPRRDYPFAGEIGDLELGAIYLAGLDEGSQGQFHVQLTVLADRDPQRNAQTAARHMPDVVATATPEQLRTSTEHVVFVCAVLGELDADNPDNWLHRHPDGPNADDPTSNVLLQVVQNDRDASTWHTMDTATFAMLEDALSPGGAGRVEYWHVDADGRHGRWLPQRPSTDQIRVPALVHEGSTMWIGEHDDAPVGLDYRPRGVGNVYVTGGSLWPRGGSWNPTMTMVALAQHLADLRTDAAKNRTRDPLGSLEQRHTPYTMS